MPNSHQRTAKDRGCQLYQLGDVLSKDSICHRPAGSGASSVYLPEDPETLNRDIARAAMKLFRRSHKMLLANRISDDSLDAAIEEGLEARPPCRFEVLVDQSAPHVHLVLDIAHNEAAVATLVAKVKSKYSGCPIRYHFSIHIYL